MALGKLEQAKLPRILTLMSTHPTIDEELKFKLKD
jgi:hypothetical protein